jgi:hypothetical protein
MQDWVKYKLEAIEKLYPPERISKNKRRWEGIWHGEKPVDRYPYLLSFPLFRPYITNLPPREHLEKYLDVFLFRGWLNDDYIPAIFPGLNNATIPNMFGAECIKNGEETTSTKLISSYDDISRLPEPRIEKGSIAQKWLDTEAYFLDETEGRIPIHVIDMQGPFDACSHIWNYDGLFICGYEEPDLLHLLLSKMTNAFILLWNAQKKLLGDAFVGTHLGAWDYVPQNNGASMSVDSLVMPSPAFYDEFYKPQLECVGKTLNGLTIHSCGKFPAVIPNINNTSGIKAIHAGQMTVTELCEAGLSNNMVALTASKPDELKKNLDTAINNKIRPCFTVDGFWGQIKSDVANPATWSDYEKNFAKEFEESICKILTVS